MRGRAATGGQTGPRSEVLCGLRMAPAVEQRRREWRRGPFLVLHQPARTELDGGAPHTSAAAWPPSASLLSMVEWWAEKEIATEDARLERGAPSDIPLQLRGLGMRHGVPPLTCDALLAALLGRARASERAPPAGKERRLPSLAAGAARLLPWLPVDVGPASALELWEALTLLTLSSLISSSTCFSKKSNFCRQTSFRTKPL